MLHAENKIFRLLGNSISQPNLSLKKNCKPSTSLNDIITTVYDVLQRDGLYKKKKRMSLLSTISMHAATRSGGLTSKVSSI